MAGVALGNGCRTPERARPAVPSEEIRELVQRSGEARSLFEKALSLEGQPAEQERLYREAVETDASLGEAHNNLGVLHLAHERYSKAIASLRRAVRRLPGRAEPRFNLGLAYEMVGRRRSAAEQYRAAVELAPEEADYLESLARVRLKLGFPAEETQKLLERALEVETRPAHVEWVQEQLRALGSHAAL